MWTVTRQIQWPDGDYMVEISEGGLDYTNPDALVEKYPGEFEEYTDPLEAVEAAIKIAESWAADEGVTVGIGHGATMGMTMPFSPATIKDLRAWAVKKHKELPRCDKCGDIIEGEPFVLFDYDEAQFCSEECAEDYYEEEQEYQAVSHIEDLLKVSEKKARDVFEELWHAGKIESWDAFWLLDDSEIKDAAIEAGVK